MTIEEYVREHFENVPEQDITFEMCNEFALFLKLNHNDDYCEVMSRAYEDCEDFLEVYFAAITDGNAGDESYSLDAIRSTRLDYIKEAIVCVVDSAEEREGDERRLFEATEVVAINREI